MLLHSSVGGEVGRKNQNNMMNTMNKFNRMVACLCLLGALTLATGCALRHQTVARHQDDTPPGRYRGAFHVHSKYSHDCRASLDLVIRSAQSCDLDFVIVTDHDTRKGAHHYRHGTYPDTPLLIFGNEISTTSGHLIALGVEYESPEPRPALEVIDAVAAAGGFSVLSHSFCDNPAWTDWGADGVAGIEVFNFGHEFYEGNRLKVALRALFVTPQHFVGRIPNTPRQELRQWDRLLQRRHVAAFGGTGAHLPWRWLSRNIFESVLGSVTTYIDTDRLDSDSVLSALAGGRTFFAVEAHGCADNFRFVVNSDGRRGSMGDTVMLEPDSSLLVRTPRTGDIRVIHDGVLLAQRRARYLSIPLSEPGVYRVEVYLDNELWIVANPIYVRDGPLLYASAAARIEMEP